MLDFFKLAQDGITIKDIRKEKPRKAWPWIAAAVLAVGAGLAWVVCDLFGHGLF